MAVEKIQIETSEINLKDDRIFKAVFTMFYPRACNFTLKLTKDEVASADIVQESFLYMWEKACVFPNMLSFKAYFYSCLKNKSLNFIRDNKAERSMQELDDEYSDDDSVDKLVIVNELKSRILEEINRTSDVKRKILLLRIKGYSYEEISKELGLSLNTVKTHKKQVYKQLKVCLSDYDKCIQIALPLLFACLC